MIKDLFDLENYDEVNKELQSLIYLENEFHPIIYKIKRKSIFPRYKNFIYHIKDKKIEKTSNKPECFSKNNAKIQKTNIQDYTMPFKMNISQRFKLE